MREPGQVCYAKTDDGAHIAYRVVGDGPLDVMIMSSWVNPMEQSWPSNDWVHERLLERARIVEYDRRGVGLSDPISVERPPTMEHWMQDAVSVLDAVGVEAPAILGGEQVSGLTALLLAATHPARVGALVLINTSARIAHADDNPWGMPHELQDRLEERIENHWPDALPVEFVAPSAADDPEFRRWWAQSQRTGASPAAALAMSRVIFESDVRHVLPAIQAETLIVHTADNIMLNVEHGRYLARNIARAKLVEVPGQDQVWSVRPTADAVIAEIEEFLVGHRPDPIDDRVLATVLFTDIVSSTQAAADLGDSGWRQVLDRHDSAVRRQLERYRGREIRTTGDGFLATFDGPARAVTCACAIRDAGRQLGIEVRAGLHTGEIELRGSDVSGIAVNIASRVADRAGPGEVIVSRTVTDLVAGSGLAFEERGEPELKGVPGRWPLFAVAS